MSTPDPETANAVNSFIHYLPFIGLAVGDNKHQSPIITRLVESAIIGAVLLYGTVQVLGKDVEWLKTSIGEVKQDIKELRSEVYRNGH